MTCILLFCLYISPHLFYCLNLFHGILQNMPISISRHPIAVGDTFKSKSLTISRHRLEQPFRSDLVLTLALGYFSRESFVANSSIGLLTQDRIGLVLASLVTFNHPYLSLYRSSHLCLAPFLGSSITLRFQHASLIFGRSTVLDSAQPFW
jgi:hypothetical protein